MDKYNNSNKKSNWQSEINEKNETSSVEEEGGRRKRKHNDKDKEEKQKQNKELAIIEQVLSFSMTLL